MFLFVIYAAACVYVHMWKVNSLLTHTVLTKDKIFAPFVWLDASISSVFAANILVHIYVLWISL